MIKNKNSDTIRFGDLMIKVRKAETRDIESLYFLLHKKYVDKYFNNYEEIKSKYTSWYTKVLNENKYLLIVIENDKNEILGHIKYELFNDFLEIMIFIDKDHRNCKIAKESIEESYKYIGKNIKIKAKILKENNISIKLFESLGYSKEKEEKDYSVYKKDICLDSKEPNVLEL